jgi:hypothetical protein
MPAAIRSVFTASVAVATAGVIAVSPLAPTPEVHIPTVQIPGIELTAVPAFGAIPYQILVNLLGDGLAIAPIVIGGIEQCTALGCIGPVSPPSPAASPFTGWGAIGFGVGLLTSPFAIVGALQDGLSLTQALGVALLAIQIPADNTFALLAADREPYGGYQFQATRDRAVQAITDALVGTLRVAEQVFTGVRKIISSGLVAVTAFAQALADTGEIITALQAGLAPVRASVETALNDTAAAVQGLREAVYIDLTSGPGPAARPIPTLAAPAAATAARVAAKPRAAAVAAAADQPTPAAKVSKSAGAHKTRAAARTRSLG